MKAGQRTRELVETFFRAAVVGIAGGIACLVLKWLALELQVYAGFGTNVVEGARQMARDAWWKLLLVPTLGMLAAALIAQFLVPRTGGAAFADVMEAVSVKRGAVSFRSAAVRSLSSLAAIATGSSVGREGPIISVSAASSSALARIFRIPPKDRALLLGCGVAAGFAGAYNAPIAGALFALEIVLGNFAMELFGPVVVSSVASTLVTRWIAKEGNVYRIPDTFKFEFSLYEVVPYLFLGVLAGFAAVGFQRAVLRAEKTLAGVKLPRWALMALAGTTVGAIALVAPEVVGNGYSAVSEILHRENPWAERVEWEGMVAVLLALALLKTVATAISVGAGASGGVFTPSLFVGAALGAAVGILAHHFAPHDASGKSLVGPYEGYALVGMGCLVAGTTRAPIMAVMVLFEMTLSYDIVLPLMLGCITASLVARSLYRYSVYEEGLIARGRTTPQGIEETVLATTRVEDVMRTNPTWVSRSATYGEIVPLITASRASAVYVCGDDHVYLGVIHIHDVIQLASLGDLGPGIIALDLASPVEPVTVDRPLSDVFEAMETQEIDELPVVDPAKRRLIGTVARRDVMAALHVEVLQRHNLRAKFVRQDEQGKHTDYVALPRGVELARVPAHPAHFGRTLGESGIRATHKLTALFVVRTDEQGKEMRILPEASMTLQKGDELIVLGEGEDIRRWQAEVGDR